MSCSPGALGGGGSRIPPSSSSPLSKRKLSATSSSTKDDSWVRVDQNSRDPLLGHLILEDYFNLPPPAVQTVTFCGEGEDEDGEEEDSLFPPSFDQQEEEDDDDDDDDDDDEEDRFSYDHCNSSLESSSPRHSPKAVPALPGGHWLDGEMVLIALPKVLFPLDSLYGSFVLTTYRVCFTPDPTGGETWRLRSYFEFPMANVFKVVPISGNGLMLHCRDYRQDLVLRFPDSKSATSLALEPPFQFYGLRETHINAHFGLVKTYPASFHVPSCISDEKLARIAKFRCEERVPALSWSNNGAMGNMGSIWRCSQPLVGPFFNNSLDDEDLIGAIAGSVLIVDCRGYGAVVGNQLSGKGGTESTWRYPRSETYFGQMGNMNEIRKLYQAMMDYLNNNGNNNNNLNGNYSSGGVTAASPSIPTDMSASMLLSSFQEDDTGILLLAQPCLQWIARIRTLLITSIKVAETVLGNRGVLVHCTHGWDRTPQVVCLAQLLVDPNRRTVRGFVQMIHREWILFGHQFAMRLMSKHDKEKSPIFLQFLDCVWQLQRWFPTKFEFNAKLLECLAHHTTSKRFVDFVGCGAKEWEESIANGGASVWDMILFDDRSLKEFYEPRFASGGGVVIPTPALLARRLELWDFYLLHTGSASHPQHVFARDSTWEWWM
ncbi:hypothetical protein BASA81_000544 [Batrachochytrium salamandrivorans]|nr:hypothetical protein BASA81_000544 [Batrachochytrium salamandrivorans]